MSEEEYTEIEKIRLELAKLALDNLDGIGIIKHHIQSLREWLENPR